MLSNNYCGYEWAVAPRAFLEGNGKCPRCSAKSSYTTEEFKEQVKEMVGGEYIVLGEYIISGTEIELMHKD